MVSNYFQHCFSCSTHGVKLLSTLLFMLYTWCQTTLNIALLALNTLSNYFRRCSSCSKHGVELFSTLPFLLYYNMNCILTFCNVERYFIEVRDRRTLSQFFQTKLVSFGRWVVLSSLVWKKKQNRTLRFVNKSLKMHLKNGIKLNGTSF